LVEIESLTAKLLFIRFRISYYEDQMQKMEKEQPNMKSLLLQFLQGDSNLLMIFPNISGKGSKEYLELVARVQVALNRYAFELVNPSLPIPESLSIPENSSQDSNGTFVMSEEAYEAIRKDFHSLFNSILFQKNEDFHGPCLRSYVLKTIRSASGVSGVISFLHTVKKFEPEVTWLKFVDYQHLRVLEDTSSLLFGPVYFHPKNRPIKATLSAQQLQKELEELLLSPTISHEKKIFTKIDTTYLSRYFLPALFESCHEVCKISYGVNSFELVETLKNNISIILTIMHSKNITDKTRILANYVVRISIALFTSNSTTIEPIFALQFSDSDRLLYQLQMRLLFISGLFPYSWIATLIFNPIAWQTLYLPSSVLQFQLSEHVRWFEKKNELFYIFYS
jgi:hypothetical protein